MLKHRIHKLTSLLLVMALVVAPLATLQAAVLAVVDCPATVMGAAAEAYHDGMSQHIHTQHTQQDGVSNADDGAPCASNDSGGCCVSVQCGAVASGDTPASPVNAASHAPAADLSVTGVVLPTEVKPPKPLFA